MPSRRDLLAALATAGVGTLAGCTGGSAVTGRWPRAGYDDRNSGYAPDRSGPGSNPTAKWTADVPEGLYAPSPVLHGDRVYLGYATPFYDAPRRVGLRVLDAGTGKTRRDVTVTQVADEPAGDALYRDSLAFADGAVYLLAFDGLYSFTPAGDRRWHVDFGGGANNTILRSGHPVVADGTVYAPTASTTEHTDASEAVYAIDAETGETRWRWVAPTGENHWTFPPAYAEGVLYVSVLEHGVFALDAATGAMLWETRLPNPNGPPTLADGRVFVSLDPSNDGDDPVSHAVALDAATGEETWRTAGAGSRMGRRITAAHDRVYHRESLTDLVARDATTGEEQWRYADGVFVHLGQAAVTDDALYVGTDLDENDGAIAVLDPETGAKMGLAPLETNARVSAAIALSDGLAVATSSSGTVYAFEPCSLDFAGHCVY